MDALILILIALYPLLGNDQEITSMKDTTNFCYISCQFKIIYLPHPKVSYEGKFKFCKKNIVTE